MTTPRPPRRVTPPPRWLVRAYDAGTPVGFGVLAIHVGLLLLNLAAVKLVFVGTWSIVVAMQLATYRYRLLTFEVEP